jgi:small neutral amino acid transporter SnatA (MarC family)
MALPDDIASAAVTLLVTVDPIGLGPIFLGLTRGLDAAQRRSVGIRAAVIALVVLLAFGLVGEKLLRLLGVGLPAFRGAAPTGSRARPRPPSSRTTSVTSRLSRWRSR